MYNRHQKSKKLWLRIYSYGLCALLTAASFVGAGTLIHFYPQTAFYASCAFAAVSLVGCGFILRGFAKVEKKREKGVISPVKL